MAKIRKYLKKICFQHFRLIIGPVLFMTIICTCGVAMARAGGGQSYSGSMDFGSSDSGSGGDLIAELIIRLLIELIIDYPQIGIPLTVAFIIFCMGRKLLGKWANRGSLTDGQQIFRKVLGRHEGKRIKDTLNVITDNDANFSLPLFYDFVQLLYTRTLRGLHNPNELQAVAPYIDPAVLSGLGDSLLNGSGRLRDVVIGALRIESAVVENGRLQVVVNVQAEHSLVSDRKVRCFCQSSLLFVKKSKLKSPGPDKISSFGCPCCGATAGVSAAGICAYCGNAVRNGEHHWLLVSCDIVNRRQWPEEQFNEHVRQMGNIPSIVDPDLNFNLSKLRADHPGFTVNKLLDRVKDIYLNVQNAYSRLDWQQARPFLTDAQFDVQRFWIDYYKQRGLRNVLDRISIKQLELVKVSRDIYYEAVTFRIFAEMFDYTVDTAGNVVSGSSSSISRSAEYWTFIRSRDFVGDADYTSAQCPSCGAEIKVKQNGECQYCGTVVTNGSFDWVLSRIDQDSDYLG